MPITFAGKECVDPALLREVCYDQGLPLAPWEGKANVFRSTAGRNPGRGAVLLTAADLAAIDRTKDWDLVVSDENETVTLKRLTVTRATCVVPGATAQAVNAGSSTQPADTLTGGEPYRVYLVELADRRLHLARVPIDKGYNLVSDSDGSYLAASLNSGSPWTWDGMLGDLWAAVGGLGTWPGLGFAPDGTPAGFDFYGGFAWDALCSVLERLASVPDYDPTSDTFTVKRIGTEPADEKAALDRLRNEPRTWDGDPADPDRANRPEKVRVVFRRYPAPDDGSSPYYLKDVTLAAAAGVVPGTVVRLRDDLPALGATGSPTNAAALDTRAAERAADWLRKYQKRDRRLLKVYRDVLKDPAVVVGATATGAAWEDRSLGLRTELESGPDGALEGWSPPPARGGGGAGDATFLILLVGKCYFDQTGGPAGTADLNCAVDPNCNGASGHPKRSVMYSWVRVTPAAAMPGPPCPVTYTEDGYTPGVTCGGPGCTPAFHERNLDLPVWPGGSVDPCCGVGAADGRTGVVARLSVYRARKGPGPDDHLLFEGEPWIGVVHRQFTSDADGEICNERIWNQETGAFMDGQEMRLVTYG